jgi:hypothetical protein
MFSTRRATLPVLFAVAVSVCLHAPTAFSAPPTKASVAAAFAAVSQYVEVVPTGGGGAAVGVGTSKRTPLPEATRQAVRHQGGQVAPRLATIATSSAYGEPTRSLRIRPDQRRGPVAQALDPKRSASPSVPSVGSITLGGGSSQRLYVLAAVLAVTTCLIVVATLRRRGAD